MSASFPETRRNNSRPENPRRACETESVTLTPGVSDVLNQYGLTKPPWTPCKRRSDCSGRGGSRVESRSRRQKQLIGKTMETAKDREGTQWIESS